MKWGIILFPVFLFGQTEFFGYMESEFDQMQLRNQQYNFGYNKLRIDMESRPTDRVLLGANLNIQKFYGKITWNFLDFLPEYIWKPVFHPEDEPDSIWISEMPITIGDTLFLDNIYLRATFNRLDLTIGRQQISLGTGYAWNPLDIFFRKDLFDPSYEQPGVNAIRVEIPLGDRMSFEIILSPEESWELTTKMVQGKVGIGSFDFTVNVAEQFQLFPYWRTEDTLSTHRNEKLLGGSFVGQIGEIGLWGEGWFGSKSKPEASGEYLLGLDHTFDSGTYVMGEYYHNSIGADISELFFDHYMFYFTGETHSLMQNYLFFMVNQNVTEFVSIGLFGIANLDDKSVAINPQVNWNAFENVDVSLFISKTFGEKDTEFGIQDWAIRIRLRAYF